MFILHLALDSSALPRARAQVLVMLWAQIGSTLEDKCFDTVSVLSMRPFPGHLRTRLCQASVSSKSCGEAWNFLPVVALYINAIGFLPHD